MIPNGLFTQIGVIIVSVGILLTYVRPEFAAIGATQDEIAVYQTERTKIDEVNNRLRSLQDQMRQVSPEDERRLNAYLPKTIDDLAVIRDLQFISERAGVLFGGATYEGEQDFISPDLAESQVRYVPVAHAFSMSAQTSYPQLRELLRLIETNEYPLEIHELTVTGADGGFLDVQIGFITYSQMPSDEVPVTSS